VNPVLCESMMQVAARVMGNDQTIAVCGAAGGQFQLNILMPGMGRTALESVGLLAGATAAFADRCARGMEANQEACAEAVEKSLAMVTALNPYVGYEKAAALAKEAFKTGKTIRELCRQKKILPDETLCEALDPWRMTEPQP
jgi:fumarate hydratase, class II